LTRQRDIVERSSPGSEPSPRDTAASHKPAHNVRGIGIVSIRDGLLALLTQGPAYGLLLRNELAARTARQAPLNVGQVYATLERMLGAGLVRRERDTDDGLPRYLLTETGTAEAELWVRTPVHDVAAPWESMRFQVLLARSLPGISSEELVSRYRLRWQDYQAAAAVAGSVAQSAAGNMQLSSVANIILSQAALDWLDVVDATSDAGEPIQLTRPRRGRPVGTGHR
jgi:DNA-binding PadR family transcriptional regulator